MKTINQKNFIYHYNGLGSSHPLIQLAKLLLGVIASFGNAYLIMIVLLAIFKLLLKIEMPMQIFIIGIIVIGTIIFYSLIKHERTAKSSYKIYTGRIDFFNERTPLKVDTIDLKEIDQVRYEDEFGDTRPANAPRQWFIYCYFKNGYQSKSKQIKKDRLMLLIENDSNKIDNIIKILQFFKEKKKQIYISTKHSKINTVLNLKNWTEPQIRI